MVLKWCFARNRNISLDIKVALVHAYSVADKLGELVLLELHPNNAIPNTPVCLDLSGTELPTLRSGELGLVHTWTKWSGGNHSLVGAAYVNRADCSKLLQQRANVFPYSPRTQFCTKMDKDSVDPKVQGGGFLVRSGSKWFLQGLYKKTIDFHRSTLVVAADVSNEEIRIFLSTALQNIRHVTTEASVSETKERQGCMGKRLQSSKVCGQFVPRNEYGVPDAADVYYLDHPSSNHMEWYVYVVSHLSRRVRQTQVGALIHPKMVLASSWKLLVTEEDETDDSSVQQKAVPAHDIAVRYFPAANGRVVLDAEVERVVLRERAEGFPTFFLYDYALLELKSAVNLMPVCLPPPGRDMLPLGEGVRGLVEADDGAIMTLVPFTSRLNDECNEDDLVHNVTEDSFCAYSHLQMRDGSSMIHGGAPFSVLEDGVWYLKGMMGEMLRFKNGTDDSYSFVEVKDGRMMYSFLGLDSDVLSWIASIVPEAPSASSAASGLRHQFASAAGTDATDKPVIATASIRKSLVPPTAKPYRTLATSMATSTGPMPHVTVTSVPKTTTRKPTAVKQISSTASIPKNSTIVPNVKPTPVSVGTDPSPSSVADSNSSSLCGRNTLPLKQLANASLPGHLPWSVMVFVRNHSDVAVNAGVLVRDDLVLTATNLLRSPARNGEAAGSIDASRLRVMWISQFGSRHWSDVIAVHVRRGVARQYDADVAVLELTTPFKRSMLPCLDLESPSRALAQLHPGQTGVEETWSADLSKQHVVRTVLQTCRVSVSQPRTLCGNGPTGMGHVGAAFLVLKRGAWHLLGIRVTGSTVMDVSESPIRSWLQDRLASEPSLSSALFFAD
ncbi:hypothetical protein ONE63_009533 [Megalurothrips usitatus]|uniref:Peptidase S1 domain-containing protein n=1 Tax=Megalurothrips usitatus TaxID=439358 RepID=A0AAV7XJW2_9NEOP|nr:hypothetical protein ONE63_009533 [Megalurothrips usitatus]